MPRRHRRHGRLGPPRRSRLTASLVYPVSATGGVVVIAVGLALAAIVEQAVIPSSARHPAAEKRPLPAVRTTAQRPVTAQRPTPTPTPVSPAVQLSRTVEQVAMAERSGTARRDFGVPAVTAPVARVSRIDRDSTWAFGTAAIPPPRGMTAMPESYVYVAQKTGTGWRVALAGTPRFAALLKKAPASVVPGAERATLSKYGTSVRPPMATGLMLPWSVGQSWALLPTDKGMSGFDGGDGRVLAAGDGRIYRLCSSAAGHGLVLLIHPNGLATEYYQLSDVTRVRDGTLVKRGDYLGRTGTEQPCGGGEAAQRMVRFAIGNANGMVPLDQVQIGGWTLHETAADTFAERMGLRVDAGDPLLNFGTMPSPTPPGSPSPKGTPKSTAPDMQVPNISPPTGNANGNA